MNKYAHNEMNLILKYEQPKDLKDIDNHNMAMRYINTGRCGVDINM